MPTLVLHTPKWRAEAEGAWDFARTVARRKGQGYALTAGEGAQICPGWKVVILDKETERQAEGIVSKLVPTEEWTKNGLQRYDIHFEDVRQVVPPDLLWVRFTYRGTKIIDG